ncbi:MAG: hypothetical protein HC859_01895 [Bacteroidia bacterium]|nr:hypothetical protein [Bacteroidia bacterium]
MFAAISIFIGCLGLYGLIAFMAHQKVKEIGVRKVFGASVQSIVLLFSKEFIQLMAFAFLIAAPLSWYAMTQWLQDFAFRSAIPLWAFGAGGLATVLLTLLTVGYRSVRAAQSNPVDTLRSE